MSTTSFRRALTIAGLALATALAAACGPEQTAAADPAATTGADGAGAVGTGGPTIIAEPTPTESPTDISPTYPDTAEAYAQEVLEAWAGDQPSWLQALTTEAVYYGIVDLNASPNDEWALLRCDGAAGSSYCSFTNADGDVLTLRISNQLLGQAHAATDVTLEKTVYPNDSVLYVKEFVEAWQFGNTARMLKLSSPAVVNKVPDTPPTSVTYLPLDCCGGGLAQVKVKIGNPTARFDVGTTLLGEPNAILDYAVEFGLTN
jgi:hypothetical protein